MNIGIIAAIILGVLLVGGGAYFFVTRHKAHRFLHIVVGAVYRVALQEASKRESDGLKWLQSEPGIMYRHQLVAQAYDLMPAFIGGVPVGLLKAYISRDKFILMADDAFNDAVVVASKLQQRANYAA